MIVGKIKLLWFAIGVFILGFEINDFPEKMDSVLEEIKDKDHLLFLIIKNYEKLVIIIIIFILVLYTVTLWPIIVYSMIKE